MGDAMVDFRTLLGSGWYSSLSEKRRFRQFTEHATVSWNALLATDAARTIDRWAGEALHASGNLPYDKAMDAVFNEVSKVGGNWHRLFDGGHSLAGAWEAVTGAFPDDTFTEELRGYVLGLWNDLITPRGLPIFTIDYAAFQEAVAVLQRLGISSEALKDMLTLNGTELVGGVAGVAIVLLSVRRRNHEAYFEIAGYLGLTAIVAANPFALAVALIAAAVGAGWVVAAGRKLDATGRPNSIARAMARAAAHGGTAGLLIPAAALAGGAAGSAAGVAGAAMGGILGAIAARLLLIRLRSPRAREEAAADRQLAMLRLAAAASLHDRPAALPRPAGLPALAAPSARP